MNLSDKEKYILQFKTIDHIIRLDEYNPTLPGYVVNYPDPYKDMVLDTIPRDKIVNQYYIDYKTAETDFFIYLISYFYVDDELDLLYKNLWKEI